MKKTTKFKRILSGVLSAAMAFSAVPIVSANAEESMESYPYTLFAASSDEGAIKINANNFCVNGNVATNGTIVSSGNMNINGIRTESAEESMIFIFDKIDNQYFSASNVDEHDEDYILDEINININVPTEVQGEATLTGNININNALKALEDVNLYGEVKNTNDSVIFSKYGDIVIDSQNVNLNGLVYAPFGSVTINAQNLNLNNVVIIAESIVLTCPSVNANNSNNASSFVGTTSEPLDIPYDEWQYMKDKNENDLPDFFENPDNWGLLKDTDGDHLPDCVEQFLGTDANLVDTDGDLLDDYYEVFVTYTDPTKPDSDDNGIDDGDEDFDSDGLTNFEEYTHKTDPWSDDSDDDGLKDGEEVNTYFTDPLKNDTDDDGLEDGEEIYLADFGFLPTNPDSDGDGILDGDERFEQTIEQDINADDDKISAVTKVSVTFDCPGIIDKYVTLKNMYNVDMLSSNVVGMVGAPIDITSTVDFDYATITFTYDEALLNGIPEENLAILWYDETNDRYVILDEDTVVDVENNTVSYTTTHFSTYLVIDREVWYDCWRENIDYRNSPVVIETAYDISFVVDVSGSMAGDRLDRAKTALNTFIDAMYPCDNACLVKFDDYGSVVSKYGSSISELKSAVSSLYASGGTSTNSGLSKALEELSPNLSDDKTAMIILICDGDVEYNVATMVLINKAIINNIAIHAINVCDSASSILSEISEQTGGTYYVVKTSSEIASVMATLQQKTVSSIDMTDSDGDGLYDVYEVNGMKIQNGQIIKTDPNKADSDNDGVSDFDEIGCAPISEVVKFAKSEYSCVLFKSKSNPLELDSDGDGFPDKYVETLSTEIYYPYDDPNPFKSDVTETTLKNDFFSIDYDYKADVAEVDWKTKNNGNSASYGGYQGWFGKYGYTKDVNCFCNQQVSGDTMHSYGCGIIAVADMFMYMFISNNDNGYFYYGDWAMYLGNNFKGIDFDMYVFYIMVISNYFEMYGRPINGTAAAYLPFNLKWSIKIIGLLNDMDLKIRWGNSTNSKKCLKNMKEMLKNDIPVVFSCSVRESKALQLYCFKEHVYTKNDYIKDDGSYEFAPTVDSHYMVATGIVEYSDDVKDLVGREKMIRIATYGKEYYVDFDDYADLLSSVDTNIMIIKK